MPVASVQTLKIGKQPDDGRVFDFVIALKAGDKDVVLGDTKEGTCGIRIAESMRLKQPKGKKSDGHIVNSEGHKNGDAWGKKGTWVDMYGPIDGKTYGIAFIDHPKNHAYPTRWHARDYGLFAANPFCGHEMDKNIPKGAASYTLKAGDTLTLRYRIYLHKGEPDKAKIAEQQASFGTAN